MSPAVQLYAPGLAIALTVLAINALGDSLRDSLDPVAGTERRVRRAIAKAGLRSPPVDAEPTAEPQAERTGTVAP